MKIVWQRGPVTVRDVYEELRTTRRIAYTTVMTTIKILETKGYLKQGDAQGRAFRYRATRPEDTVISGMVREFVNRVFNGASGPLLVHLVRQEKLTNKEREELRRLIREAK